MKNNFKPLALEDFKLTSEDLSTIVEGSQKFLPPAEGDDNDRVDTSPEPTTS